MGWTLLVRCLSALLCLAGSYQPVASGPDQPDWRPNVGPEEVPAGGSLASLAGLILLAANLGLLTTLAWLWLRRLRSRTPAPAHRTAVQELEQLQKQASQCTDPQALRRYATHLSWVLRGYLDQRYGLHAREQTTPEFLASLAERDLLHSRHKEFLHDFFVWADLVKFAGASVSPEAFHHRIEEVRQFLQQTGNAPGGGRTPAGASARPRPES